MRLLACAPGRFLLAILVFSGAFLFHPGTSRAEIYKYEDKDGVIHFTNVPTQPDFKTLPSFPLSAYPPRGRQAKFTKIPPTRGLSAGCDLTKQSGYDRHIFLACRRYDVNQNLVKAVIRAESAFDPFAVSPKGAMGLMQLMPGTSRDLGVNDPMDPYQNIDGGVRYLRFLLDRFNDNVEFALAAYNAGPENVQKHGGVPPYDETRTYVQRVMDYYSRYSQ